MDAAADGGSLLALPGRQHAFETAYREHEGDGESRDSEDPDDFEQTAFTVTPLASGFVAEIGGLDLARPLAPETFATLRGSLLRYKLLLFRGQSLTPRQQRDFAAGFGKLHTHPLIENV
ncbi:MAG TPA: TauD/TfdA family dioxygenase, partial [Verrucomicrobiae bacterium]|nr:TauD/TfdA family dioxygenase [Verrucomicrobiae bacterium]